MLDITTEPAHVKDALSRIVVEIAKREWPQEWPGMMDDLNSIYTQGVCQSLWLVFTCESSYCFQRVLTIAILSVCLSIHLSVTQVDQSKTLPARITKFSPSAAQKTLVSRIVKLLQNEGAK